MAKMEPVVKVFICTIVASGVINFVDAQTGNDAKDLYTYLFTNQSYNARIRPANNQSLTTNISVSLGLVSINGLDEVSETLTTTAFLIAEWYDDFLTWTPSSFGNIQEVTYPQNDIWKPDIALKNSVNDYKQLGDSSNNIQLGYNGYIQWVPHQVFASTCAVNIKYFPFDIQTCTLTFVAYSYTTSSVYMSVGATGFDTGDTDGNPQWKIRSTSTSTYLEDGQVFVQFTIKLERKPEYYVINFILPIVMLSLLDIATFILPCDSGEKSGYAITVFLSLAVYFSILSNQLPESSDVTSVFSVYVLVHALLSTMITLLCLCFIRVSSFDEKRNVPTCLRKLTIFVLRMNVNKTSNGEEIHKKSNIDVNEWIPKELEEPNVDWKNVVNALDIVCFCVFAFISFIVTLVCLTICSSQT